MKGLLEAPVSPGARGTRVAVCGASASRQSLGVSTLASRTHRPQRQILPLQRAGSATWNCRQGVGTQYGVWGAACSLERTRFRDSRPRPLGQSFA